MSTPKAMTALRSLHVAAVANASATAEVLLKAGADANAKNNKGLTPLGVAAALNDFTTRRGHAPLRCPTLNPQLTQRLSIRSPRPYICSYQPVSKATGWACFQTLCGSRSSLVGHLVSMRLL